MFFPSPPLGIWRKKLPTIFRRILLVMPRSHAKYSRTLYPNIPGGFNFSNLYGVPKVNMPVLIQYHIIHLLRRG